MTWNKLYKKDVISRTDFPEELAVAEDNVFQFWVFLQAKRVLFRSRRVYVYCANEDSAMATIQRDSKEEQHRRAIALVEQKLNSQGQLVQYAEEFNVWKHRLLIEETGKKSTVAIVKRYVKEYGMRSAMEHTVGKYIIRK